MNTTRCLRIKLRGRLSERLATAFDGVTVSDGATGTELVGVVVDQAQLHGLLSRIRDLGLELEGLTIGDAREDRRGQATDDPTAGTGDPIGGPGGTAS